jgi:hypothetical protein
VGRSQRCGLSAISAVKPPSLSLSSPARKNHNLRKTKFAPVTISIPRPPATISIPRPPEVYDLSRNGDGFRKGRFSARNCVKIAKKNAGTQRFLEFDFVLKTRVL